MKKADASHQDTAIYCKLQNKTLIANWYIKSSKEVLEELKGKV